MLTWDEFLTGWKIGAAGKARREAAKSGSGKGWDYYQFCSHTHGAHGGYEIYQEDYRMGRVINEVLRDFEAI